MNRVEVWYIEDEHEIEETVNDYCRRNELNPFQYPLCIVIKRI